MVNTGLLFNPINWFIVFFMLLIPCLGMELILNRKENGCGCGFTSK